MSKNEVIAKMKSLINDFREKRNKFSTDTEAKPTEAKLDDNTTIVRVDADDFKVGIELKMIDEDGETIAKDGDYKLSDGRELTVKDGKISQVKAAETEEKEEEMKDEKEDKEDSKESIKDKLKSLEEKEEEKEEEMKDEKEEKEDVKAEKDEKEEKEDVKAEKDEKEDKEEEKEEEKEDISVRIKKLEDLVNQLIDNQVEAEKSMVEMSKLVNDLPGGEDIEVTSQFSKIKQAKKNTKEERLKELFEFRKQAKRNKK